MKKISTTKAVCGAMMVAGLAAGNASGESIIAPTAAILLGDSGNFGGGTIQSGGDAWINGAGLESALPATFDTTDVAASLATLSAHTYGNLGANGGRIRQSSPFDPLPTITFALDGPTDLTGLILWNHGEGNATDDRSGRGWSAADLSFTTAADPLAADAVFSGSESLTFDQGPQGGTEGAFLINAEYDAFSATFAGVTGVRFSNIDTFLGAPAEGTHLLNVSEIRFTGTAALVPEPTSLALLSLGAVGALTRRRTRATKSHAAG